MGNGLRGMDDEQLVAQGYIPLRAANQSRSSSIEE